MIVKNAKIDLPESMKEVLDIAKKGFAVRLEDTGCAIISEEKLAQIETPVDTLHFNPKK